MLASSNSEFGRFLCKVWYTELIKYYTFYSKVPNLELLACLSIAYTLNKPRFRYSNHETYYKQIVSWLILCYYDYAGSLEFVPQTLAIEQPISKAFQIANKANLSREEMEDQERREMFIQYQRGALAKALEQGIQRGMAQNMFDLYLEGVITGELLRARLERMHQDKSLSEEIYKEFITRLEKA